MGVIEKLIEATIEKMWMPISAFQIEIVAFRGLNVLGSSVLL